MIANTTTDLNEIFRREVKDPLEGFDADHPDSENLWKEAEIYQYMTEAIDMLSKLTGGRYKTYQLPVTAGVQVIHLPRAVLEIRSARLVNGNVTLLEANANQYLYRTRDDYGRGLIGPSGMFGATGSPANHYVRDYDTNAIRLIPEPTTNDTLEIQCDISSPMLFDAGMPLPFTDTEDQRLLLHYMKYIAYMKHDADTEDLSRADTYKKLWDRGTLERASRLRNYRRAPGAVTMNW